MTGPARGHTLRALASAVHAGSVTAASLVERAIDRIAAHADLNAVVAMDADAARRAAAEVDRGRVTGRLAGLPVLVKDLEHARGLPTTWCSTAVGEVSAQEHDSYAVAALRREGAVVLGKANSSEFGWEGHACNHRFGATRNPWARDRSPGGSSGGSAAAVSAGLVPIATATDVGGSTRAPGAQCGLLGFKPTNGLISTDGPGQDQLTAGILAAHPDDVRLQFEVMARALPAPRNKVERLIVSPRIVGREPLDPVVAAAFSTYSPLLKEFAEHWELDLVDVDEGPLQDARADTDPLLQVGLDMLDHLGRDWVAEHRDSLDPSLVEGLDEAASLTLGDVLALRRRRWEFQAQLDAYLDTALLVTPTLAIQGLTAEGAVVGLEDAWQTSAAIPQSVTNTNVLNWTWHPGLSVPAGTFASGTPFGIQLTASRFADTTLIAAAETLHGLSPWPLTAPGYEPFSSP